ncbi:MAG: kelch repeat-containing protein [Acidobacteriota bacterium]
MATVQASSRRALVCFAALTVAAVSIAGGPVAHWPTLASMNTSRAYHTLTALPGGKVLAVGGHPVVDRDKTAEVLDVAGNAWTYTAPALYQHSQHAAVALADGRVLVAGGQVSPRSVEIYDAAANRWLPAGSLGAGRYDFTLTRLKDDRVLAVGGWDTTTGAVGQVEVFDASTNSWSATAPLVTPRELHCASLLPDGRVIVAGGFTSNAILKAVEIYDPAAAAWRVAADMREARARFGMVTLTAGVAPRVLAAGGCCTSGVHARATSEVYDPLANTWIAAGDMSRGRTEFPIVALKDGSVLVAGGEDNESFTSTVDRFNPKTQRWDPVASTIPVRAAEMPMLLLGDGRVLVSGGTQNDDFYITTPVTAVFQP